MAEVNVISCWEHEISFGNLDRSLGLSGVVDISLELAPPVPKCLQGVYGKLNLVAFRLNHTVSRHVQHSPPSSRRENSILRVSHRGGSPIPKEVCLPEVKDWLIACWDYLEGVGYSVEVVAFRGRPGRWRQADRSVGVGPGFSLFTRLGENSLGP